MKKWFRFRYEYFVITFYGVFLCWGVTFVVFNFEILNPLSEALVDFHFSDLYYSKVKCSNTNKLTESPVILMDVDTLNRGEMVQALKLLSRNAPSVIGLDVIFREFHFNAEDSALRNELLNCKNLVINYSDSNEITPDGRHTNIHFGSYLQGFDNFIGKDYTTSTVRSFYPFIDDSVAFALRIAEQYEQALLLGDKTKKQEIRNSLLAFLHDKKDEPVEINYSGNCSNFITYYPQQYFDSLFNGNVFKDKIVIVGIASLHPVGRSGELYNDVYFTPLNSKLSGRSYPDMHGAEIHANIVQQLLSKSYIHKAGPFSQWLTAYFICLLMLPLFLFFYSQHHIWFHAFEKVMVLVVAILFLFFIFGLLHYGRFKMEPEIPLLCIFLFSNMIYFYDGTIKILNKFFDGTGSKFKIPSIFTQPPPFKCID